MGWIQFISQKAEEEEEEEQDQQGDPQNRQADPLMLKCAQALCTFCMIGQRSIWLNFPDIFDGVFACTKSLLVSNIPIKRSLKTSLLQLHVLLNKWSMSNVPVLTPLPHKPSTNSTELYIYLES
uniref:DUF7627 domain-containing protein n=1 Tax=Ditylenchus dipsaci TaxID=166011 RepID=A0A915EWZ1_9BILA